MQTPKLLIVEDNVKLLATLRRALGGDFAVVTASTPEAARAAVGEEPDVVLLDIRLDEGDDEDRSGMALLPEFISARPSVPVLMFSGFNDVDIAVECMKLGASDFINKSAGVGELRHRLAAALGHARLSQRVTQLEEHLERFEPAELIGDSPQTAEVRRLVQMVARDGYVSV